jgi:hypothetical protein
MRISLVPWLLVLTVLSGSLTAFAGNPAPSNAGAKVTREQLSDDDRDLLDDGPIGDGPYIAGGVVGTLLGLGIGHAIQGRYGEKGWIFTVSELASAALIVAGAEECVDNILVGRTCSRSASYTIGTWGLLGFRIWEIVDLWAAPPARNKKYRRLKRRLGESIDEDAAVDFILSPIARNEHGISPGISAGVQFRF